MYSINQFQILATPQENPGYAAGSFANDANLNLRYDVDASIEFHVNDTNVAIGCLCVKGVRYGFHKNFLFDSQMVVGAEAAAVEKGAAISEQLST